MMDPIGSAGHNLSANDPPPPPRAPEVFIVVGAGSGTRQHLRHGQFAAMRWQRDDQRPSVDGDGLNSGAVVVLGTLVHEAAHALAHVRNINDTSRPGSLPHQALEKLDGALHIYRHRPRA